MCRTGLTEEKNIKKPRGQALINFTKLAGIISRTCLGFPSFSRFAFVFLVFFFSYGIPPPSPRSPDPPKPSPFPLVRRRTNCCLCKTLGQGQLALSALPWASGPVPSETARFTSGMRVQRWLKSARLKCCTQSSDSLSRNTLLSAIPLD